MLVGHVKVEMQVEFENLHTSTESQTKLVKLTSRKTPSTSTAVIYKFVKTVPRLVKIANAMQLLLEGFTRHKTMAPSRTLIILKRKFTTEVRLHVRCMLQKTLQSTVEECFPNGLSLSWQIILWVWLDSEWLVMDRSIGLGGIVGVAIGEKMDISGSRCIKIILTSRIIAPGPLPI